MRRSLLLLSIAIALLISGCAPVAQVLADMSERNDGASLTYVLADHHAGPGLVFDSGGRVARGVIVRAEGEDLALLVVPEGATCTVEAERLDCRLGDVGTTAFVGLSGKNVIANATWRRAGRVDVYLTFAKRRSAFETQ